MVRAQAQALDVGRARARLGAPDLGQAKTRARARALWTMALDLGQDLASRTVSVESSCKTASRPFCLASMSESAPSSRALPPPLSLLCPSRLHASQWWQVGAVSIAVKNTRRQHASAVLIFWVQQGGPQSCADLDTIKAPLTGCFRKHGCCERFAASAVAWKAGLSALAACDFGAGCTNPATKKVGTTVALTGVTKLALEAPEETRKFRQAFADTVKIPLASCAVKEIRDIVTRRRSLLATSVEVDMEMTVPTTVAASELVIDDTELTTNIQTQGIAGVTAQVTAAPVDIEQPQGTAARVSASTPWWFTLLLAAALTQ